MHKWRERGEERREDMDGLEGYGHINRLLTLNLTLKRTGRTT